MPDIQKFASEIQQLQNSFAWWTNAALWLTAVTALAAVGYFVASRVALAKGDRLPVKQEELAKAKEVSVLSDLKDKDKQIAEVRRQAEKDKSESVEKITDANARIAEAQRGVAEANASATKAQESVALAEQHSAEANAKAESFRLDIATANARAASANEIAERERLARLQLEARLADRILTPTQQAAITARLALMPGITVDVLTVGETPEIQTISGLILTSMRRAGWTVNTAQARGAGIAVRGILVGTRGGSDANTVSAANLLVSALRSAGLDSGPWPFEQLQPPDMTYDTAVAFRTAAIMVFIGSKPTP